MKRNILIFLAAFAALLTVSCEKPEPEKKPATLLKSPARITVGVDDALTKTVLGEDGLSILWDGTESLGVFDGIATAPNKFDAASAGATTSFTGEVSDGAENFIVFYPYQAEAVVSDASTSTIKVRMPAVQQAVKDGFDPAAGLAARLVTSLDEPVKLYNQFALLKVNVDQDGVTAITVSATNRKLAGGIALKVSTNGGSNGDAPTSNSVTLKNADDSALEQGLYYIAVRPSSTTSPYQGFAMEVVKNGVSKTRTASNNLVVARNHILSIGKVSALFEEGGDEPFYDSRYEAYMAGKDIVIGGVTLNRTTHGSATLLTAEDTPVVINKSQIEGGGVVFLKGSFSTNTNPTISSKDLYLIADSDENADLALGNVFNIAGKSLMMYGLNLTMTGGKSSFLSVNKNASGVNMESFVMDHCLVTGGTATSFISTNSSYTVYGVKNISITNSKFAISVATNIVNVSSTYAGISVYKSLVFNDNYVYSTTDANVATSVFGYSGTVDGQMSVSLNRNLFYNTAVAGTIKHYTLLSATASKNLYWTVDASGLKANPKMFGMGHKVPIATVNVTDNVAYGPVASGKRWSIADSGENSEPGPNTGMEAITVPETDPIATADVTTGTFTMATGYTSYGPQL